MATALKRVDVKSVGDHWVAKTKGGSRPYATGQTKAVAVRNAAKKARRDSRGVALRIHGRDGRIQEERTYPGGNGRSSTKR